MIEKTGNDLLVIASHPQELAEGQLALIQHVKQKESEAQAELASFDELFAHCRKAKVTTSSVKRLKEKVESKLKYLARLRSALESGYVIVPNFPGTTIAVRVKRERPAKRIETSTYDIPTINAITPVNLPEGEGRYVGPLPFVQTTSNKTGNKKYNSTEDEIRYSAWPTRYDEEINLPVEFLKPTIVQMTGKTMARKLFDEILVIDGNVARRGDPMVLGRIVDRKNKQQVTFLIAWFIDSKDII